MLDITFYVRDKLYHATISPHRPMAVIIPDQHVVMYTVLSPKPDSSTRKNRYRKVVDPTEEQEIQIDRQRVPKQKRSVFSSKNELNPPKFVNYSDSEPIVCQCRLVTVASPAFFMPR